MVRLLTAFAIAALLHAAILLMQPPWPLRQPPRLAHREALTMRLVARQAYHPPAMQPLPRPPSPLPPKPPEPPRPKPEKPTVNKPIVTPKPVVKKPKTVTPTPAPKTVPAPPTETAVADPEPVAASEPLPGGLPESDTESVQEPVVSDAAAAAAEATVVMATPRYRNNPLPVYPRIARKRGIQGTVILEVFVEADGRVGDLRIAESSSHRMLDRAAQKTVRHWMFEPGRDGRRAVAMWVRVPVDFRLQ